MGAKRQISRLTQFIHTTLQLFNITIFLQHTGNVEQYTHTKITVLGNLVYSDSLISQSLSHTEYIAFIAMGSLFDVLSSKLLYIVVKDRLGTRLLRLLNCNLYVICNFLIFENFLLRNVCA